MTNKLGDVIEYAGGRAIHIEIVCPRDHDVGCSHAVQLPECMNNVPVGMIAYIDHEGKIAFSDGDPND